MQLYHKERGAR